MLCRGVIALVLLCSSNLVSSQPALRGQDDKAASTSTEQVQERALQVNSLREKFQTAKAQYYQKLHQDYGEEYTVKLFSDVHPTIEGRQTTVGRTMFLQGTPNAQVSWDRLVRKMTSKLIDAQQGGSSPPTFVWSTGGHSASAGHGNFFDESYTNVLDRNAAPVFKAVGIDFKARSYAMGGTSSGVEIASCAKEIFGLDADIVSWDYGMCDGRNYERTEFYAQRISMIPTRPAVVMLQTNNDRGRLGVMERLTDRGMTALGMADSVLSQRDQLFPDCAELDMSVIETLPKFIRNYRCGNAIEKQEPLCGQEKFSSNGQEVCDKRKFKTSWYARRMICLRFSSCSMWAHLFLPALSGIRDGKKSTNGHFPFMRRTDNFVAKCTRSVFFFRSPTNKKFNVLQEMACVSRTCVCPLFDGNFGRRADGV